MGPVIHQPPQVLSADARRKCQRETIGSIPPLSLAGIAAAAGFGRCRDPRQALSKKRSGLGGGWRTGCFIVAVGHWSRSHRRGTPATSTPVRRYMRRLAAAKGRHDADCSVWRRPSRRGRSRSAPPTVRRQDGIRRPAPAARPPTRRLSSARRGRHDAGQPRRR